MLMQKCPQCGAENSVRRATCYQCQHALTPPPSSASTQQEAATESSRWDSLEIGRRRTRPRRRGGPAGRPGRVTLRLRSGQADSPLLDTQPRPTSYMPMVRHPLGHVRKMGIFFRQLHALTQSGFDTVAACREMERRAPLKLRGLAREMREAAEAGRPISEAMGKHGDLLYPWHLGLIGAAQAGGFLPAAFDQIAAGYEAEWETRSAVLWPTVLYTVLLLPGLMVAIPALKLMSEPIPEEGWTPQSVLQMLAYYTRTISLPIVLGILTLIVLWQLLGATAWFQAIQQRVAFRLPLIGSVARTAALDRYLGTLGMLLQAGVAVGDAAEQAALAAGNHAVTPKLLRLVPQLREGVPLSQALAETRLLDADTLSLTSTGEVAGALPEMLSRAAAFYREQNESKRRLLMKLFGRLVWVLYAVVSAVLFIKMVAAYFDYAFRVGEWITG